MRSEYLTDDGDLELLDGDIRTEDTPRSDVLLALLTPYGSCSLDPTFGDRTYQIQKVTRASRRQAETYAHQALDHLVKARRILDLEVEVTIVNRAFRRRVSYRVGANRDAVELRTPIGG